MYLVQEGFWTNIEVLCLTSSIEGGIVISIILFPPSPADCIDQRPLFVRIFGSPDFAKDS